MLVALRYAIIVILTLLIRRERETVLAGEQRPAFCRRRAVLLESAEKFPKDDARSPYVDLFTVVFFH